MTLLVLTTLALAQDPSILEAEAEVVTIDHTAVGSEVPFTVSFSHTGGSAVTVSGIDLVNTSGTAFTFDGSPELVVPEGGVGELALRYEPTTDGLHLAELTVHSDADCTAPQTITLRGSAFEPCVITAPEIVDFGRVPDGETEVRLLGLQSCDGNTYTVDDFFISNSRYVLVGPPSFDIGPTPSTVTLQFTAIDDASQTGDLVLGSWESTVRLVANDCYAGNPENYDSNGDGISDCGIPAGGQWADADGDGFAVIEGDCNDSDADIFPGAEEVDGGQDDNCNGEIDEHSDRDGDGSRADDCDDENPWVSLGVPEVLDGWDNDCDGEVDEGLEPATCEPESDGTESGGCGCAQSAPGGGLAGLLILGLLGLRRRQ